MLSQVTEGPNASAAAPSGRDRAAPSGRRVAVLTHTGRPAAVEAATRLIEGLWAAGISSALPAQDLDAIDSRLAHAVIPLTKPVSVDAGVELMVVLGGDGTILRGAEWVVASNIPLLGVNLGHIGFLAEAESSEIDSIVAHVVERSYTVEERFTIDISLRDCESNDELWSSYAVNEVSIEKAARERMLEVLVEIDGRPLSRWACDGMLVSTPTGSTAYAFSAGGPVIWPGVDALLVVPLSAHALFARPMVLSPTSRVVVEMLDASQTHGVVWCDGRRSVELRSGMRIEVTRGRSRLRLARLSLAPFTDRLVNKFGLRVEGWRGGAEPRLAQQARPTQPDDHRTADHRPGRDQRGDHHPGPRPDRGDRGDRRGQDDDRHGSRPAARRPHRRQDRAARCGARPGGGPVRGAGRGPGRPGGRRWWRTRRRRTADRAASHRGRPLPGVRRRCAGARTGLRAARRATDRHPRPVGAVAAVDRRTAARTSRPVRGSLPRTGAGPLPGVVRGAAARDRRTRTAARRRAGAGPGDRPAEVRPRGHREGRSGPRRGPRPGRRGEQAAVRRRPASGRRGGAAGDRRRRRRARRRTDGDLPGPQGARPGRRRGPATGRTGRSGGRSGLPAGRPGRRTVALPRRPRRRARPAGVDRRPPFGPVRTDPQVRRERGRGARLGG